MIKDWRPYAEYILDTIDKINRYQQRGDICSDELLYDAILRNLQTLSEATQRLPEAEKQRYPQIPWREISGFRNILVHNYLGEIDPQAIAQVLRRDLPVLADVLHQMLSSRSLPAEP